MLKVDYDAIKANAVTIKGKLNGAKLCAVVKCNAYGHGLNQTVKCLDGVSDCFAVGNVVEADVVKDNVMILLPCNFDDTVHAVKRGYTLTLDSFDTLKIIDGASKLCNTCAHVHIKIDSGMGRLGFVKEQLSKLMDMLPNNIVVSGVYSHFATTDNDVCYRNNQYKYFLECCGILGKLGNLTKHIANTSAVVSGGYNLDMVRVGLGLYGYGDDCLVPAKSLTANVISVKRLVKGFKIGYDCTYTLNKDSDVAIINVGYADGLPRIMQGAKLWLNGKRVPVIGNVCMGMTMLNVTNVKTKIGDEVEVFGKHCNIADGNNSVYTLLCNTN